MQRLIVIGGGTAGLRTALAAAARGAQTKIIEPGILGGTCLNTGCIPTKALLHASHLYKKSQNLEQFGIQTTVKLDFKKLMSYVNWFPETGQAHINKSIKKYKNLEVLKNKAKFIDSKTVQVGNKKVTGDKIIIATGSKNFIPPINGLTNYLDNISMLKLKKLPKSVVLIGGGYISMEYATFFNDLGCKVTVLELLPNIMNALDQDVIDLVGEIYEQKGVTIITGAKITEVNDKVYYEKEGKISSIKAEKIFVATGRLPNTRDLNLDAAGIKTGRRGEIITNDYMETSVKDVYAIGDVTGKAMFAHTCKRESKLLIRNLFDNERNKMPYSLIPWAAYTDPPIAGVGKGEKDVRNAKLIYAYFSRAGRASVIKDTRGFVKIIHKKGRILGSQIIGPNADDIIHEIIAVMNSKSPTIDTIRRTIHVHPTLSEVLEELK